jgi:UDP-N-acetylmuramoylalanine--D-glutamate ligase
MLQTSKIRELSFLVYGLGITGLSVIKFFKRNNIKNFQVWDDNQKNLFKYYKPKNLIKSLNDVDFIILSPGISLIKNKKLLKFKEKIITDLDLFYLSNNKLISIVVTGTNGKSTTCKLLAHLLKMNHFKIALGGNIGTPILDLKYTKNCLVIIEASSFQLSHSKFICPNYALFLNFTNDHLDWHGSMANYLNSKLKIFKLQKKNHFAIINKKLKNIFIKKNFSSKIIIPDFRNYKNIKFKIDNDYLTSEINNENMSFVYTISKLFKINKKSFIHSMKSFKGLPHRFETFLKRDKTIFINDSKATSFKATQTALSSLKNIFWILGGLPKQGDKIKVSKFKKNIIKCYLIGTNTNFFKNQIKGKLTFSVTKNLKNTIFQILKDLKLKKYNTKYILLSPAAASYDQFSNFENRGNEFKRICRKYVKKFS